jgi:hypothetical protein
LIQRLNIVNEGKDNNIMLRLEKERHTPIEKDKEVLHKAYEEIVHLESEIQNLTSSLDALHYEMKSINQDEPLVYKQLREERASEKEVAVALGSGAGISGGILGLIAGTPLGFGLGAVAYGSVALHSYYKNNWSSPITLEYNDIHTPFVEAKPEYTAGKFEIIDSKPEQGIYKAQFYPDIFTNSEIKVSILVKKKILPWNAKRIEAITKEIQQHEDLLRVKHDELRVRIKEKDSLVEKVVEKEMAIKKSSNRLLFFEASNNEKGLLEIPAQDAVRIKPTAGS